VDIGVAGAGGIGSYYAGLLSRAGHRVRLIARGDHLAAIEAKGLEVRTPSETFVARPDVTGDAGRLAGCEYVIVAVKGYSLPEIGPALKAAAASGAAIVPLLNGVDVPQRLEALGVPRASIVGGLVAASLVRSAPGVVERRSAFDRMALGELDRVDRPRATKLVDAMTAAGTDARVSGDIMLDSWRKFAFIVPMTVACGLSRQPMGPVLAGERGRDLVTGALREIVAVSRACGAFLSDDDEAKVRTDLLALPAGMRPSFLADLEAGGPTELDLLAGAVSRLGREGSVATPIHDVATAAFESATRAKS
jgi:2-dehydropantoate 2-reductase